MLQARAVVTSSRRLRAGRLDIGRGNSLPIRNDNSYAPLTVSYGYIVPDVLTHPEMALDVARLIAAINSN